MTNNENIDTAIHNHEVAGSSPALATLRIKHLHPKMCRCFLFLARFLPRFTKYSTINLVNVFLLVPTVR